ncbi:DNA methyltransferase [Nocardiopsis sp. CNR-923]|uniref:Eco57I restriction-modification methylase domain-containing protein n=1 Tax=Nocardiopsis sp. CNR-923 TaxID=1904965 RepID=UPI000965D599|nr:Eco57I restriction-modification methylase domain-containing protein [Nocardiopsis sp. CNR-923]OLT30716.1 DNA methyltransferase [Nocardiopsis sp. CNR-923]
MREAITHGEVFTKGWVVELILDLVGYTPERDLATLRSVEPACGSGAFLGPIARRLSESCRLHGRDLAEARQALQAFDLLEPNITASRALVQAQLLAQGWDSTTAEDTVRSWIVQGDYLLLDHRSQAVDFVVGNPPYIRLEDVPRERTALYRAACPTMGGRADIYVGFYEVALRSLKPGGQLGFICADRWMHNQYGARLREFITSSFSVDFVLAMHDVDAFEEQVTAYPAITVISHREQAGAVAADTKGTFTESDARELHRWSLESDQPVIDKPSFQAVRLPHWFDGAELWPTASPARLAMLEDLSDRFGVLENREAGTRVGIGIATGADKVFITTNRALVEADRLLPLAMVRDTGTGKHQWQGNYLVNPWTPAGDLVDLDRYPRLRRHLGANSAALRKRYVAVKQPERWYKTIDKVDHSLLNRPKLLLPDMKTTIHPVLAEEGYYPHHNLYYIVSDTWDLSVLGGLLMSKVAQAFVQAYSVKMRGGTLRFQAQYLRKIRVPEPSHLSERIQSQLAEAFRDRDVEAATDAALVAYGLDYLPD